MAGDYTGFSVFAQGFANGFSHPRKVKVPIMATEYGNRLKAARKHAGFTQERLRDITGVPQSTISSAERDGHGSAETPVYAKACGVSAMWLATGEGEMIAEPMRELTIEEMAKVSGGSGITTSHIGTAKVIRQEAMTTDTERRLTRLMAVLFQIPESRREAALVAATETLLDHLPPPPSA